MRLGRRSFVLAATALVAQALPRVASATVLDARTLEELTAEAVAIVHARVVSVRDELRSSGVRRRATLACIACLKGQLGATFDVEELGGVVRTATGERREIVAGAPVYAAGDEVVVWLRRLDADTYSTLAMSEGRVDVVRSLDGRSWARRDLRAVSIRSRSGRVAPGEVWSVDLDVLLAHVRALVEQGS